MNVSGGYPDCGYTHDMSGMRSVLEVVLQLRGAAGERQLEDVKVGLAQSWAAFPQPPEAWRCWGRGDT